MSCRGVAIAVGLAAAGAGLGLAAAVFAVLARLAGTVTCSRTLCLESGSTLNVPATTTMNVPATTTMNVAATAIGSVGQGGANTKPGLLVSIIVQPPLSVHVGEQLLALLVHTVVNSL